MKRVLIVDDEPNVVGVLREFFTRFQHGHAYDVVSAQSVAEAVDILLRELFDLILLDMVMPRISGLDLLKRVRDLGVKAPVLMMTGGGDTQKEAEALIAGAIQSARPGPFRRSRPRIRADGTISAMKPGNRPGDSSN